MNLHLHVEKRLIAAFGRPRRDGRGCTWCVRPGRLHANIVLAPMRNRGLARIWVFDAARGSNDCAKCFAVNSVEDIEVQVTALQSWLGQPPPIEPVLAGVLNLAMSVSGARFGDVQVVDRSNDSLRLVAHRNLPAPFVRYFKVVRAEVDDTVCARAYRRGSPFFVPDVQEDPPFAPYRPIAEAVGFRAVHSIPLMAEGCVVGVVSCLFAQPCEAQPAVEEQVSDYVSSKQAALRARMR